MVFALTRVYVLAVHLITELESISGISILDKYGVSLKLAFIAADLVDTGRDFTDQTFLNVTSLPPDAGCTCNSTFCPWTVIPEELSLATGRFAG